MKLRKLRFLIRVIACDRKPAILLTLILLTTFCQFCAEGNEPPPTEHRIDGKVWFRWPKSLYEGSSGVVYLNVVPSGRPYEPDLRDDQRQSKEEFEEKTLVYPPRVQAVLTSDTGIDITSQKQELTYDLDSVLHFSWSVHAKAAGSHLLETRIYLERKKDEFSEMSVSVSPRYLELEVYKVDGITLEFWTWGMIIGGFLGAVSVVWGVVWGVVSASVGKKQQPQRKESDEPQDDAQGVTQEEMEDTLDQEKPPNNTS